MSEIPAETPEHHVQLEGHALSMRQTVALAILCFQTILWAGLIFGWSSMAIILRADDVYACSPHELSQAVVASCPQQTLSLAIVYTTSQFFAVASSLPVGFLMDASNPETVCCFGLCLIIVGCVFVSHISEPASSSSLIGPAFSLISAGGSATFFPTLRMSERFQGYESIVITLFNSLFDASAMVLPVVLIIYSLGVSRRTIFIGLAILALLGIPATLLVAKLIPSKRQANDPSFNFSQLTAVIWSRRFGVLTAFTSLHVLRSNSYLGTVGDSLKHMGDDGTYTRVFGLMLPLGVITTPVVGRLIDRLEPWHSLIATNAVGILQGFLSFALPLRAQPVAFAIYVLYRTLLYSALVSCVAKLYGYEMLGRLLGTIFIVSAAVTLLQYPLVSWTVQSNGGSYMKMDLILTMAQFPLFLLLVSGRAIILRLRRLASRFFPASIIIEDFESAAVPDSDLSRIVDMSSKEEHEI